jgi:glycosyltransferase involved in cell wall biosynthesis
MRVTRIYHAGRDSSHRARERALVEAGVDLRLIVPTEWPGVDDLQGEEFEIIELPVSRPGDVNRHRYRETRTLQRAIAAGRPDIVDVHEEPFSAVGAQVRCVSGAPVVMYTAQNLDKRWPPPFAQHERRALRGVAGFYPCSRQAASVLRGKGYRGPITPIPLGIDMALHRAGPQQLPDAEVVIGLVGRLVPEKGLLDAIQVLRSLGQPARLLVAGSGPEVGLARGRTSELNVEWHPWLTAAELSELYRRMHIVLVPSRATATWVEQFGRVIPEGWANGAVPVGYRSGSIPEVVDTAGVIVDEGNVEALSFAVQGLIERPDRWADLRREGLARAQQLSWARIAAEMIRMYELAMRQPLPPPPQPNRAAARQEFGPPARTSISDRPFALPMLRQSRIVHRLAERLTARSTT